MQIKRRRPPICERRHIEPGWQALQTSKLRVNQDAIWSRDLQSELQGLRDKLKRAHDGLKSNLVSIPLEDLTDRTNLVTEREAKPN